jgi:hypothetical protein
LVIELVKKLGYDITIEKSDLESDILDLELERGLNGFFCSQRRQVAKKYFVELCATL